MLYRQKRTMCVVGPAGCIGELRNVKKVRKSRLATKDPERREGNEHSK